MTIRRIIIGLALLVGASLSGAVAQERVDLAVPVVKTSTQNCALDYLALDVGRSTIMAVLKCNNGDEVRKVYDNATTPTGAALLTALNTSNNSAGTSLIRRIYNRLIADGVFTGSVSGVPQ